MSFLFETFKVPFWFLIFILACVLPLWVKWSRLFYRKIIATEFLKNKIFDSEDEFKSVNIFRKATNNWNASADHEIKKAELKKSKRKHDINSVNQPYVKIVLKILALKGDAGMLIQSISDNLEISSNEIKKALSYLEKNEFVEAVAGSMGAKYYLSLRGKKYCIKRKYIKG